MRRDGWLTTLISVVLAMTVFGAAAGVLWLRLATPARWEYTEAGLVLTESAAGQQFGIVAWYVLIGVVTSAIFGWVMQRRRRAIGWYVVPLVVVGSLVAAVVASRVGLVFGPADPRTVGGLQIGDTVPMRLELGAFSPLLTWVAGGLLGIGGSLLSERSAPSPHRSATPDPQD